jgi:hypothetical protein
LAYEVGGAIQGATQRIKELLNGGAIQVMDCIEEQRIKYVAYKFSREARRLWYAKRNSLVMELGSEEANTWTRFKEEFY